jgi:hypothetical protein
MSNDLDSLCIAVEGIGFGSLAIATMGFVVVEVEVVIVSGRSKTWISAQADLYRQQLMAEDEEVLMCLVQFVLKEDA